MFKEMMTIMSTQNKHFDCDISETWAGVSVAFEIYVQQFEAFYRPLHYFPQQVFSSNHYPSNRTLLSCHEYSLE
jgi:hypothetical protein